MRFWVLPEGSKLMLLFPLSFLPLTFLPSPSIAPLLLSISLSPFTKTTHFLRSFLDYTTAYVHHSSSPSAATPPSPPPTPTLKPSPRSSSSHWTKRSSFSPKNYWSKNGKRKRRLRRASWRRRKRTDSRPNSSLPFRTRSARPSPPSSASASCYSVTRSRTSSGSWY
jgi:hypothetical protein